MDSSGERRLGIALIWGWGSGFIIGCIVGAVGAVILLM